ncbi:MAG: universal stress protein [Ferruginibacter sp.]|nr:universal stress protein [Ferruginibacter sp.]
MKKILIALDYNPTAEKIAETGYELAKAMNAEVILLHVVAEPTYYSNLDYSPIMGYTGFSSPDMLLLVDDTEIKKASLDFLEQSKKHLGDDQITTIVGEGDCADAVLKVANDLKVDIIVMGTHSRRGLDKILMGSISEKVLHHTDVPLFIIPSKHEKK